MKKIAALCLLLTGLFYTVSFAQPSKGDIQVNISGLKNTTGQVGILLFQKADGFPSNHEKAMRQILLPISGNNMQYTFTGIPYGKYAVSVMHDANRNKKLDLNFLGIPTEGNGVSNNATSRLGPPKFEDALFSLDKQIHSLSIKVTY